MIDLHELVKGGVNDPSDVDDVSIYISVDVNNFVYFFACGFGDKVRNKI